MRSTAIMSCMLAACSFDPSGPAGSAEPGDAGSASADAEVDAPVGSPDAAAEDFHLRVEVLVDGASYLIIQGTTVQWQHWVFAAPGRWQDVIEPTILNDVSWYPDWPDVPTVENRDCNGCLSSTYDLPISVPRAPSTVTLTEVQVRRNQNIVQEPAADNDYTLIVEITDQGVGGGDQYIVEIDVTVD